MSERRAALTPTLVVEDDPVTRAAIRGAMEDAGFHPLECADLAAARSVIRRMRPAVIVLDLSLGEGFGAELLEELSHEDEPPAVVVCSAFPLAGLVAARYSVPYIKKPFELDELVRAVERAVSERLRPRSVQSA